MTIQFTKMHALGNDFMVIDGLNQNLALDAQQIAALAQRNTGIGFDQCLVVERSKEEGIDFFYRIFNADGQEVGQCGNGARCLARFLHHYGLTKKKTIRVATFSTKMDLQLNDDKSVTLSLDAPKFDPEAIPLQASNQAKTYDLVLKNDLHWPVHALSVGNPHAISLVEKLDEIAIDSLGKEISEHPLFPEHCNAGFMQLIDSNHIQLRVYERGCGETQACGSGAVAAAIAGQLYYDLDEEVIISLPGGELKVAWPGCEGPIYLTGPASFVYEGVLMSCA